MRAVPSELYPRFIALDADGRRHVLRVVPGARGKPSPSDPLGRIPGPKRIMLEGGGELERVGRGRYVTLWGEVLTSNDPEAP